MEPKLGNKIRLLRKQRGVTQEELAKALGICFQSVSKWENGISLPDIAMTPAIADYFGVSMDELFDYRGEETRKKVLAFAKASVPYRGHQPEAGIRILEEGLRCYPGNEILMDHLLYLIDYNAEPDRTLKIAKKLIACAQDGLIRCDALRFAAYAYRAKKEWTAAREMLQQIPELPFSKFSEQITVLKGREKLKAARKQKKCLTEQLTETMVQIAETLEAEGCADAAAEEYETAAELLELLCADADGRKTQRDFFSCRAQRCRGRKQEERTEHRHILHLAGEGTYDIMKKGRSIL